MHYIIGHGSMNIERDKNVVVLLNVLPDTINVGYHRARNEVIRSVNGEEFVSFEEFVRLIESNKNDYLILKSLHDEELVISTENIDAVNQAIMERNHVPSRYSEDVANWIE